MGRDVHVCELHKKITGQWLHWQESNGTFILSTEKSNGHSANSISLWPMSDVDVHSWWLVATVIFDYKNPHCDLELLWQQTSLLAWYPSPWLSITIPSLVAKGSAVIIQMNIHWNFEPFMCPWPWPWQSNPIFSQDNPAYDDGASNPSCKRISSSADTAESGVLIIWSFIVSLTLKTANQPFWKTIWLMMMHHHTKFGSERFNDSEDIFWTNN